MNNLYINPNIKTEHKQTKNRPRKLARCYQTVAAMLLENSRAKSAGKKGLSQNQMLERIFKKHGVSVERSTLHRYIACHHLLKLL